MKEPVEEVKSIRKTSEGSEGIEELRGKLRDLEITNRVKDHFIERLEKDREAFGETRQRYVAGFGHGRSQLLISQCSENPYHYSEEACHS